MKRNRPISLGYPEVLASVAVNIGDRNRLSCQSADVSRGEMHTPGTVAIVSSCPS
jgi:hypothetical protein